MGNEPESVISLRGAVAFAGWLMMIAGALVLVFGCSRFTFALCSPSLIVRSTVTMGVGAAILIGQWVAWGDQEDIESRGSVRSRLRKVALGILIAILFLLLLAIVPILPPGP